LTATIYVDVDHPFGAAARGVAKRARLRTGSAPGTADASGAASAPRTAALLPSMRQ
jgi:hypothetical protein